MARPIEWRALAVVLLGASVCLGKGGTPIDGAGCGRSGDLAIRGDGAEGKPTVKASASAKLPGRALRCRPKGLPA